MYDILHPATSINVLYEYLASEHKECYCYRGQTREYDCLVPSLYRRHVMGQAQKELYNYIPINPLIDNYDERQKLKLQETRRLFKEFGAIIGNILAQQYGLNSECLDITSDLKVASFFATHRYPEYNLHKGSESNNVGIIYRIKKKHNEASTHAGMEFWKSTLFSAPDCFPYNNFPILYAHHRDRMDEEQLSSLNEFAPYTEINGITPHIVLSFMEVKQIIESYVKESNSCHFLLAHIEETRFFKQSGGMIIPSILYKASIPINTSPVYMDIINGYVNKPGLAVIEKMIGIEDIAKYSFVEKFYFRHGDAPKDFIDLRCDKLWPDVQQDYYFKFISYMINLSCAEYLKQNGICCDDRERGIIDRGYYK